MFSNLFVKLAVVLLTIVAFGTLIAGSFLYYGASKIIVRSDENILDQPSQVTTTPTPTPDPLAPYNVLLLGYGGPQHDGGYLTDTMIVANINPKEKRLTLISIPRDIWIPLPVEKGVEEFKKINHAYAIGLDDTKYPNKENIYKGESGAGELAKYATKKVVGMPIRHFAAVSFDGFKNGIDIMGGVNVVVPATFTDKFYPLDGEQENTCGKTDEEIEKLTATLSGFLLEFAFECRYEELNFEAGSQYLDANTALKFVRSRHSKEQGGDFSRSQRQKALVTAIKDKILSLNLIPKFIPLYKEVTRSVRTDINLSTIRKMLSTNGDPSEYTVFSITLSDADDNVLEATTSDDLQFILIPKEGEGKWNKVHQYIQDNLNNPK